MWFAFKLVSLNHWEQSSPTNARKRPVVICFQISIFEPLGTIIKKIWAYERVLWFAFKLVSLNHWEQSNVNVRSWNSVVICFQISIFEPLGTISSTQIAQVFKLWFAFKLVSLNHWEQCRTTPAAFNECCDLLSN